MIASGFGLMGVFGFAVLAGQIVGVIGLAKAGRTTEWWLMASGVACTLLGNVFSIAMMVGAISNLGGSSAFSGFNSVWMVFAGLSGLGSLLFAAGFAMHGMRALRISSRHSELEMLVKAQTEEIRRLTSEVR
jgi:hypothetical protein